MLKVLIIDDEPLAHDVLAHHCRADGGVTIAAHCLSAAEALAQLESQTIDAMFLDIRMPLFGGLDMLRGLSAPPLTVIVSAHQEFALDGFELDVVDYLLKPVSAERFAGALARVRRRLGDRSDPAQHDGESLILKVDRSIRRLRLDEITYLQAQGNFVKVSSRAGTVLATSTLSGILAQLPPGRFVQLHRSFIVNRARVAAQQSDTARLDDGTAIPIGRSFRHVRLMG